MIKLMNIAIIGHGGHGKDTVCEYLESQYGVQFVSSSMVADNAFIFDALKDKYNYKTPYECYMDRSKHRKEWADLIKEYIKDDLTLFGRLLFSRSPIYCGLRNIIELKALKDANIIKKVIWVDAIKRLPPESNDSISITMGDADIIVDNNRSKENLYKNTDLLIPFITES